MDYNCSSIKERSTFTRFRSVQEKSIPKFLRKVFHLLEENKHNEYASWSHDGAAIVIKKPTEFAEKVLPCYFKHNNLASFVRQLNMYNFKKKKNYHYDHAYGHEMFQKGKTDLLRNIQRKTGENNQILLPKVEMSRAQKEEIEVDVDYLLQENLQYKRVQKTLSTQLQFIERKVKDIKTEMNSMYRQSQKQSYE
jgi:heat shock transcription factor 1